MHFESKLTCFITEDDIMNILIIPLTFYHCVYHCESSEEKHFFTLDLLFSHTDPTQEPEPLNQGL